MTIQGTIPVTAVSESYTETDRRAAVKAFRTAHPTARVTRIDGAIVRGVCACGQPILEADRNYQFGNGQYTCLSCLPARKS